MDDLSLYKKWLQTEHANRAFLEWKVKQVQTFPFNPIPTDSKRLPGIRYEEFFDAQGRWISNLEAQNVQESVDQGQQISFQHPPSHNPFGGL